jgi:hypothetical protein
VEEIGEEYMGASGEGECNDNSIEWREREKVVVPEHWMDEPTSL